MPGYEASREAIRQVFNEIASPDLYVKDQRPKAGERNNFSDTYSTKVIESIVKASTKHGVDPYTALAISTQETNMGNKMVFPGRFFHAWSMGDVGFKPNPEYNKYGKLLEDLKKSVDFNQESIPVQTSNTWLSLQDLATAEKGVAAMEDYIDAGVGEIKNKMKYMKQVYQRPMSEEFMLQGWRGMGKAYGEKESGYKTRSYGKRIIDLRENMIKKSPEIRDIVESYLRNIKSEGN